MTTRFFVACLWFWASSVTPVVLPVYLLSPFLCVLFLQKLFWIDKDEQLEEVRGEYRKVVLAPNCAKLRSNLPDATAGVSVATGRCVRVDRCCAHKISALLSSSWSAHSSVRASDARESSLSRTCLTAPRGALCEKLEQGEEGEAHQFRIRLAGACTGCGVRVAQNVNNAAAAQAAVRWWFIVRRGRRPGGSSSSRRWHGCASMLESRAARAGGRGAAAAAQG